MTSGTDDPPNASIDRHPTALGRHLDDYLAAVARELQARGVLTGSPQRTEPDQHLIGSIALDCTAMRLDAWTPTDRQPAGRHSLADAPPPGRPVPVIVTWDEYVGWGVELRDGPARRYLRPERLPPPSAVADFVADLALGRTSGTASPVTDRPRLRLIR